MSLVGIVNLAERLLNQSGTQGQDAQVTPKTANGTPQAAEPAEDLFTPSTQNGQTQATAQDAGLFSVSQLAFFSAAANFLLGETVAAPAAPAGAGGNGNGAGQGLLTANTNNGATPGAAQDVQTTAAAAVVALTNFLQPDGNGSNGGANAGINAANNEGNNATNALNAANTQGANPAAAAGVAAVAGPLAATAALGANANAANATNANTTNANATNGGAAGGQSVQQQLIQLNNALAALGLNPREIQELDQVASIINDFNPSLFTVMAIQLEELAQQVPQAATAPTNGAAQGSNQAGTAAAAATNTNTATNANAAPTNGTGANGAGFQVQELVIRFAGVEAQGGAPGNGNTNGAAQGAVGNGNAQVAAFNLQIEEVNLTLVNANGQTAQIQTPAANTNPLTATKTRAAGA